uniref:CWF19-like protein 2 n=1 Tax=Myripristis murdjan TaxID=586833 RepID=A0A668ACF2_9TELE
MAAYGGSFESANSIDERRENKRQARQEALEKAKQQYEREERRKELKRQRGEDMWMLPEVNQRLEQIEQETSDKTKRKKEKKSKKSKKEKKKKAKKEKKKSEAKDGPSDSSEVGTSAPFPLQVLGSLTNRDEWMTFDFLTMRTTSTAEKRAEKERQKEEERAKAQAIEQAGLHKLELNPYWKDGGSGLPPEEQAGTAVKKGSVVEDGGLSWLRKSYQRMKEQAEREQRSLNDVVAERYGSMEEFQKRLADAEKAAYGPSRGREGDSMPGVGWRKREEEAREGWRRREGDREARERWRSDRERDSPPRDRERYRVAGQEEREKGGHRERERERGRDGDRYRERDRGSDRDRNNDRDTEGWRNRDRDRDGDRERNKERDRERDRIRDRDRSQREDSRAHRESSSSEQNRSHPPLSLGSLKGRFLKPSEDDDSSGGGLMSRFFHTSATWKNTLSLFWCQDSRPSAEDQEVLLFRTDQSGRAWPVNAPSGPQEPRGGRRKKKAIETHVAGERVRYFQDDDSVGLQEMVRREKMSSAQDQNALYSRMASKMMGKTDGDNYTLDDMFVSSAVQREGEGREEERMRSRAIGEHKRLAASMEKCQHCFSSQELQKHLIVAIGSKVYLSLPVGVSMTEGHCLIAPLQHHCSATGLDEDIWTEMQLFRRALVRMFESQELDCVFMETHMNPRRRQHMVLECIPLPRELGDMAPIYFKKAIMECDEEWAMNKKIVDLSSKDIRHAIPRGLPYFAVDFGLQGGFAHVIENEHKFPHYFGKEVVGGMMDLEPRRWRKPIRENFDDQRKKVLQFAQWWKPYDCSKANS